MIDYTKIKLFTPSEKQQEGIDAILNECEAQGVTDLRQIAYILGTVYHEVGGTMQPIEEVGRGRGRKYGHKLKQTGEAYIYPPKIYYGRSFVQLTWYENYERFGKYLKIDLLNHPELALDIDTAAKIAVIGMKKGMFTGRKLSDYFNEEKTDWINARKIINSLDCAEKIEGYAIHFFDALKPQT